MKWICQNEQMREADRYASSELHIPGILLMEAAARSVADRLCQVCCRETDSILFLCGGGNNGGDGFAAARMMKQRGYKVRIFCVSDPDNLKGDAKINYDMLSGYQLSVLTMEQSAAFREMADQAEWVVDAMLGTGLDRPVRGFIQQIVTSVNEMHAEGRFKVLSIDIPSGVNGDNGKIMGCAIEADETITFCRLKAGLLLFPGRDCAGKVTVADIGIPDNIAPLAQCRSFQLEYGDLRNLLPQRKSRSHKGLYGHLLIFAGCRSMTGAAYFSTKSAYKVGAGLVETAMPKEVTPVLMGREPEAITYPYETGEGHNFDWIRERIKHASAVIAGPGLGKEPYVDRMLKTLFSVIPDNMPMVLDADALNALSRDAELKAQIIRRGKEAAKYSTCEGNFTILTPHMGEAARLLNRTIAEVMDDPQTSARQLSDQYNSIVVLKDAMTLVANRNGDLYYNSTGNNGMSTAGSGDVLSGMIGGLLGQGMDPYKAAYTGVFLHGAAGDLAKEDCGTYSMTASDLMDHINLNGIIQKGEGKEEEGEEGIL